MQLQSRQRWMLYAAALIFTLIVVFQDGEDPAGPVAMAQASIVEAAPAPQAPQGIELERLQRQSAPPGETDPFAARSWRQLEMEEQRRNAPPEPPPKPQAPPLPFTYLGKMVEGDQTVIFLSARDRNYVARVGETLDGVWRVESIGEQDMSFDYVPLRMKQRLSFASAGGHAAPMRSAPAPAAEEEQDEE